MSSRVKIGLEIHVQLRGNKLFCNCPTESSGQEGQHFVRKLTARSGESGKFDPAAIYEKSRSRSFEYAVTDNSCLLEADEEPPHHVNSDALMKAVSASLALGCKVVDEVSYMRKIVIDGSNTSGFQRTSIIGFNGRVDTSRGPVGIASVCLEEDSARKLSEKDSNVVYSLDRLGIPLMEIATDPDIVDGDHAVETAELVGKKLLLAGWVRRSPEAIRQDVNFSMGYGRVEMKGVPKLSTIRDALSYETSRQTWLSELAPKIKGTDWTRLHFVDVSEIFRNSESKVITSNLSRGKKVFGTVLPGLDGYLKRGDFKMGRELADVAKLFGSGGIMHSDELPGYGVEREIPDLKALLSPGEGDGYTIVVSSQDVIGHIESAMVERLQKLEEMDLTETRVVSDDGTTHYLRPLPGGERMYPETDVPVIPLDGNILAGAESITPESEDEMIGELVAEFDISKQDAKVILNSGKREELHLFSSALQNSRIAARLILQIIPELEHKSGRIISDEDIMPLLTEAGKRKWDRQVVETAVDMKFTRNLTLSGILESTELMPLGDRELSDLISELISAGEANLKNIVPKLKSKTKKSFDPARAIRIAKELIT